MKNPGKPVPRMPPTVWILGLVSLLMDVSSEMIHSLLPVFLTVALGSSAETVGFIEGIAESTALIAKMFSGALSDWLGRRKLLALAGYGLGAASKPLFALAGSAGWVLGARFIDRIGKGVRGAPRDALIADVTAPELRGAAFGLRQSLDTIGAFLGPLLALALMLLWHDDFRRVFWVAVIPGMLAVALLTAGVREPARPRGAQATRSPISRVALKRLPGRYWLVVGAGAALTLARFSEAFLVLRAQQGGLPLALTPLVLIGMNVVYAAGAYPLGALSDRMPRARLLMLGIVPLAGADLLLGAGSGFGWLAGGVMLWGLHMAATQGLMASMVADAAPAELRGTAFGLFNLASGVTMLLSSVLAGVLWTRFGAPAAFHAGAGFALAALLLFGVWRKS